MRYDYHTGLTSYDAAIQAGRDAIADGEISLAEDPQIQPYTVTTKDGRKVNRWKITLQH